MKHTPGPWQVIEDDYNYAVFQPSPGIGRAYICREISQGEDDGFADATLIAAAPDLLEALEKMVLEFSRPDYELFCDHSVGICSCAALGMIEKAKETIKKARGL